VPDRSTINSRRLKSVWRVPYFSDSLLKRHAAASWFAYANPPAADEDRAKSPLVGKDFDQRRKAFNSPHLVL
jgi:hypothetical protein